MTGVADEADVEPPDENVLAVDPTGRYICYKESVGEGAFKTVYKAFDEIDGIEVAWSQIKVTGALSSPAAVEMLRSELRLLKSLRHNNIIKYYKSWEDESNRTVHIITELFSSGSLRQYCLKHKKVDMRALKGWARQILSGLEYLHSQNPPIIHRDIKCDNIFINGNHGEVKIGDLGLATVLHQPSCQTMIGTPEFMAPEYYEEEYNELVDIYSFGMCMLEMVTLEYPYSECDSALQIIKKVISGKKPAVLSKVADPELKAFIEKCITNVSERPSASELLRGTFLQTDGANRSKPGLALLSADAVAKKSLPVKIPAKPEQPVKSSKMESRPDLNVDDEKLIVNTLIQSYADGRVLSVTCKVSKTKKDKKFLLTAQREGEGEGLVEFDLQIATGSAKGRQIDFTFYVDSDTASLIASELVEQDEIGTEDAKLITEMMESLLINLSQAWNASVTSNQLTVFDNNKACGPESEGAQSAAYETNSPLSSQITWEALDIPKPAIIGPSSIDVPLQHMPEPSETGSHDVISCSFPGPSIRSTDDLSDPSLMSICSFDENDKKLSLAFMCSPEEGLYSLHHFESETKTERVCDENGAGANEVAHSLDATCSPTVEKFNNGDDDDDEKLRLELEIIELLYQQMISDIYQKKNEALVRARIGAASKNPLAPLRVMSRCSDCS